MNFSEKLKMAMQQLGINQAKVVSLTGKSKGSISQYISGKQTPSEEVQKNIAVSLGLNPDYFEQEVSESSTHKGTVEMASKDYIQTLDVTVVAKLMQMNHNTVRKGLQQGVFPWGYAIQTSENRWVYFINAVRFSEIEHVAV